MLKAANPHPRDEGVVFDGESHTYSVFGSPVKESVTKFVSRFFEPFDADAALSNLGKWAGYPASSNKKSYLIHAAAAYKADLPLVFKAGWNMAGKCAAEQGRQLHACIETSLNLPPDKLANLANFHVLEKMVTRQVLSKDKCDIGPFARCIGASEQDEESGDPLITAVRKAFTIPKQIRLAISGAIRHNNTDILNSLCDEIPRQLDISFYPSAHEAKAFADWLVLNPNLKPYRTEFIVYSDDFSIAGAIDALFKDGEDFVLVDWKRSADIGASTCGFGRTASFPFSYLPDTKRSRYELQLTLYAWLLHAYYGIEVRECRIVSIHPKLPSFEELTFDTTRIPFRDVEAALDRFAKRHRDI